MPCIAVHAIKYDELAAADRSSGEATSNDQQKYAVSKLYTFGEVRNAWDLSVHCRLRTVSVVAIKLSLSTA